METIMKLEDALEIFLLTKSAEGLKASTLTGYQQNIVFFARTLPGGLQTDLSAIQVSDISRFMLLEAERGMSVSTIRTRHRALKMLFDWLADSEEAGYPPSPMRTRGGKIRPKAPAPPAHMPRRADPILVDRLIDSIPQETWVDLRDRAIIQTFKGTGIRVGELVRLCVGDLDMVRRFITIRDGKGSKDREVPVSPETGRMLSLYILARPAWLSDRLFLSTINADCEVRGELKERGAQLVLARRCEAIGFAPMNPHSLRHMFATKALNDGMPLAVISQILGHTSVEFTAKVYARWERRGMQRQYDRYWVE